MTMNGGDWWLTLSEIILFLTAINVTTGDGSGTEVGSSITSNIGENLKRT
jgi:hypothetical protein